MNHESHTSDPVLLTGLQASSGAPAAAADITAVKRASSTVPGGAPPQKKKAGGGAAASFWSVLGSDPFHSGVDSENPRTFGHRADSLEGTFWKVFMDQNPFRVLRATVLLIQTSFWTRAAQSALVLLLSWIRISRTRPDPDFNRRHDLHRSFSDDRTRTGIRTHCGFKALFKVCVPVV